MVEIFSVFPSKIDNGCDWIKLKLRNALPNVYHK